MLTLFGDGLIAFVAYVASIYTWPWIRTKLSGVTAEITNLRAKANALEASIKTKV